MGANLDEQAVQVQWKTTEITAKALKELIKKVINNRGKIQHGEQKLKKLNLQGKKLENVELSGKDIKIFRRELKKYSVDFSVMKNRDNGNYLVFFKAQDVDRVYNGLHKCVQNFNKTQKKQIKEVMKEAKQKSEEKNKQNNLSHEHKVERGKEER